mmetsp:Transcript_28086/g.83221  ORF Transcript_28086/g.83221 Transcript_28086/m.83221 type:complete len:197 (-) Transcript_28086:408-998(-)
MQVPAIPVPPLFGVFFVGQSYPIYSTNFVQVDPTHWVLDVCVAVQPNYWDLKEVSLFLMQPNSLDPTAALGLYLKVGPSEWLYRGCSHNGHPNEVMPLQWPDADQPMAPAPGIVQIGVSMEPAVEILAKEGSKMGARTDFAKRVGMDLFRFMESFQTQQMGNHIVVPENALDRWFIKFTEKFKRDPDFLTRQPEQL